MMGGRPNRVAIALAVLAALLMLVPLLWVVLLSLKSNAALLADSNSALRPPYTFENYRSIFGNGQVFRWIGNSLIVSLGMTAGVLALSSLAGYGFARLDFPFRRALFVIVLAWTAFQMARRAVGL